MLDGVLHMYYGSAFSFYVLSSNVKHIMCGITLKMVYGTV
jgi:hypothetical protein